ncbi:hypothetical protein LZ31DRAFT_608492, partial [Colletotrichum somersetense]
KDNFGKRICCNSDTVERFGVDAQGKKKKCIWRGAVRNCNGAGSEGEVVLFKSGNGGGPTESDQSQCSTGYKYFTCPLPDWDGLTSGCRWTGCKGSCNADETEMAYSNDIYNRCPHQAFSWGVRYCCKGGKRPLSNCHWVGQGHCDDNTCNPNEVTAARNSIGDGYGCRCEYSKKVYGRELK